MGELPNLQQPFARRAIGCPLANSSRGDAEKPRHLGEPPPFAAEPFLKQHLASLAITKPQSQATPKPFLFSICYMGDVRRRAAFQRYLREELGGDRSLLMARTGLSKGRISQLLDPKEPFGEKAAQTLAQKLGLRPDYFSNVSEAPRRAADASALSSEQRELLTLWEPLFEDERVAFLQQLRQAHANALRRIEEMRRRGLDKFVPDGALDEKVWARPAQRDLAIGSRAGPSKSKKK